MNFGEKIKELRIKNKLTQQDFADKFFVTRQAVSRWEQGKSIPSIDVIELIAKEFDVSIDYLVSDEDELEKKEDVVEKENIDSSINHSKKYNHHFKIAFYSILAMLIILFVTPIIYLTLDSTYDEYNYFYASPVMISDEEVIKNRSNWNVLGMEYYLNSDLGSWYIYSCKEKNGKFKVEFVEEIFSTNDIFDKKTLITKTCVILGTETTFNYCRIPELVEIISFNIYGECIKKEVFQINEFDDASYNVYNATSYTIQAYYDDGNKLLFNYHLDSTYSRCKTNVYLPSDNILRKICLELY